MINSRHWRLREELYQVYHNWPYLVAFFLLGALLGWLAGFVWPSYHQAARRVYVGLNPYRTYSDARFLALARPRYSNIDNYHYWQMYQLETAIFRNEIMKTSLERLAASDPYWENLQPVDLRSMLGAEWRTAGEWRLTAEHADEELARKALEVWSELAIQSTQEAVAASRDLLSQDQQLATLGDARLQAQARRDALQTAGQHLPEVLAALAELDPLAAPPADLRWRLFSLTAANAGDDPAWQALLSETPAQQDPTSTYLAWATAAYSLIQAEKVSLPASLAALDDDYETLRQQVKLSTEKSLGLSPNLEVESFDEIEIQTIRPSLALALIGGFIGMLGWLLVQIRRVSRAGRPASNAIEMEDASGG